MGALDGKVALVTGASAGIGRETAKVLGGLGAAVVITARRAEKLEETAGEIPKGRRTGDGSGGGCGGHWADGESAGAGGAI